MDDSYNMITSDEIIGIGLNKVISKKREDVIEAFKNQDLRDHFINIESGIKRGYRGREFLEQLQNMEDAFLDSGGEAKISLVGNNLEIYNTGKPFNKDGVKSIIWSHNSGKANNDSLIGAKGLGMRSLLNIADSISIFSDSLSIRLSRKDANDFYTSNTTFKEKNLPIFMAPKIIKSIKTNGYTTLIKVKLKASEIENTKNKLDAINHETVVFLHKISKLTIIKDNDCRIITKTKIKNNNYAISTDHNGKIKKLEYTIISDFFKNIPDGLNEDNKKQFKDARITLAYSPENKPENYLYCYFPTAMKINLPWLIHANFNIKDTRDAIQPDDQFNKAVLEHISNTLFSKLELWAKNEKNVYDVAKMLINNTSNSTILNYEDSGDNWNFDNIFYHDLRKSRIWPTIDGNHLSFSDGFKHYTSELAKFVEAKMFSDLTTYSNETDINDLIEYYNQQFGQEIHYNDGVLVRRLNKQKTTDRIKLAGIIDSLLNESIDTKYLQNAKVFLDKKGYLRAGNKIIFENNGGKIYLPSFAKIEYIDSGLYNELCNKNNNIEYLCSIFKLHRKENIDRIVELCTKSVGSSFNRSLDFLRWLFLDEIRYSKYDAENLPIPTKAETVEKLDEVYLSSDYCPSFCEKLWNDNKKFICNFEKFKIDESRKSEFIAFLKELGISDVPHKQSLEFDCTNDKLPIISYENYAIEHIKFPCKCPRYGCAESIKDLEKMRGHFDLKIDKHVTELAFDDFENILKNTNHITLFELLMDKKFDYLFEPSTQGISGVCKKGRSGFQPIDVSHPSYVEYLIKFSPWIKIRGKKYAPAQIVLSDDIDEYFLPNIVGIAKEKLFPKKYFTNEKAIDELIDKIGINKNFETLNKNLVYKIALMMPEKDPKGIYAKRLYNSMIRRNEDIVTDGDIYDNFIKNGKIFCKDNLYHEINTVYYSRVKLPEAATRNKNLAHLPSKQGSIKIKKLFGVKEANINYTATNIIESEESVKKEFKREFDSIKIAVLADINTTIKDTGNKKNNSYSSLLKLNIIPCSGFDIQLIDENRLSRAELFDYAKSKKDNNIYLNIDNYKSYKKIFQEQEVEFPSVIVEIFETSTNLIDNPAIRDYTQLSKYENRRKKILCQYNGDETEWKKYSNIIIGEKELEKDNIWENNRGKLYDELENRKEEYKIKLYESLKKANIELQKEYWSKVGCFNLENFRDDELIVLYDKNFNVSNIAETKYPELQLSEQKNDLGEHILAEMRKKIKKERPELIELFDDKIINGINNSWNALARFGRAEEIIKYLQQELKITTTNSPNPSKNKERKDILVPIHPVDITYKPGTIRGESRSHNKEGQFHENPKINVLKQSSGELSEKLAYNTLTNIGYEVHGVSKNAKKLGLLRPGDNINDMSGYDMYYFDENNVVHYVEVKTASVTKNGNLSFLLSGNEYNKSKEVSEISAGNTVYEFFTVIDKKEYKILNYNDIKKNISPNDYTVNIKL